MKSIITVDHQLGAPKYQQIIQSVITAIDNKQLKIGDKIPSVNEVSDDTGIAKKTVVQAFEHLKQTGIIMAVKYKGYFVASANTQTKHHIFVLFNNLTAYKEEIYESIKSTLGNKGVVEIFFHHNNMEVFKTLIAQAAGKYTEYIIMPIPDKAIKPALKKLPQDKIYMLDLGYHEWGNAYPSVCQYFDEDIYLVLKAGLPTIRRKYSKLVLVQGPPFYNQKQIEKGFRQFCREFELDFSVIPHARNKRPAKGELYVLVHDQDLVHLVKKTNTLSYKLGRDVGVISYNDIPIKEIVGNGITTISTDFTKMGTDVINMILRKKKAHLKNPCRLVKRASF
ncbi:MAG TPA: substrate-binding domain-containing protein [Chitinophaga sp.]|uniref:GntR family transcriptional regulator n=1 Tax=Chitinophaga sp. TaxID=1869181 RepID=UPI002DBF3520|nr:substrate-binding domain-containing protein [Chitinophaga sp.]HEU4553636.1 substrate-binding domain-containing protein [Chitinophaga sp.]